MKYTIRNEEGKKISDSLFGIFFEDINYGLDGGLSAELLENRNFEALETLGGPPEKTYHTFPAYDYAWSKYPQNLEGGFEIIDTGFYSEANPHHLLITIGESGKAGFSNKAYSGIWLKKGMEYNISFFAKTASQDISVTIQIVGKNGDVLSSSDIIPITDSDKNNKSAWKKYETKFAADKDIKDALFVVNVESEPGESTLLKTIEFDFFSMKPADAVFGVFRKDLYEALRALKPAFIRFPGGCVVEGNTLENRYKWKESVGPVEFRKNNWNRWAVHRSSKNNDWRSPESHYNQTLAIGFYEYFIMCEDFGAEPLPIVNVGMACQYQSEELVEIENPIFNQYIQDALDLVEFANGDATTNWGSVRAKMGHPAPFNLKSLGIGNEQWETDKVRFFERYREFEKVLHKHYPKLNLVGTAGPDVTSNHYSDAWSFFREEIKKNPDFVYAVDEHYYMPPNHFLAKNKFYDEYPRDGIKVFAGEYAAHVEGGANNWEAGIAEAAFLTGIERNADVVCWAAYAPLFARKGFFQWYPDLIWFDEEKVYETPSYYVQQMFSTLRGNRIANVSLDEGSDVDGVETVCSYSEKDGRKEYFFKLVNTLEKSKTVSLLVETTKDCRICAEHIVLESDKLSTVNDDVNCGVRMRPVSKTIDICKSEKGYELKFEANAYSFNVIKISE